MKFNETLELLTTGFQKFINTKTVVGEPFHIGEVSLVPIISVTCGIGGGGGEGNAEKDGKRDGGVGVGAGGGFRVHPVAIVVIKGQEVTMMPINKKSGLLEKLVDAIPDLAVKLGAKIGKGKEDDKSCECDEDDEEDKDLR